MTQQATQLDRPVYIVTLDAAAERLINAQAKLNDCAAEKDQAKTDYLAICEGRSVALPIGVVTFKGASTRVGSVSIPKLEKLFSKCRAVLTDCLTGTIDPKAVASLLKSLGVPRGKASAIKATVAVKVAS